MTYKSSLAASLVVVCISAAITLGAQAQEQANSADLTNQASSRPDYNGPYRYPPETNLPATTRQGSIPCNPYDPYYPCPSTLTNTYYEQSYNGGSGRRGSQGYIGIGVPDSAQVPRDYRRNVPRQPRD